MVPSGTLARSFISSASPVQVMLSVWMSTPCLPERPVAAGRGISDFVYQPVSSLTTDTLEMAPACLPKLEFR
ncbi:hypothetical protein DWG14_00027 [Streptomyces griseorubiginosus]|uniref:Uncharacterized protein n=1 Tax=Streptomyces griseorubiginosus TaxID=67304 RepID=A0AAI8KTM7_9ACTN|nr:hypothetical protein DWG14_00027 [Streptomyces griseorubiginosus]